MNKKRLIISAVLAFSLMATTAYAAPGGKAGGNNGHSDKQVTASNSGKGNSGNNGNGHDGNGKDNNNHDNNKGNDKNDHKDDKDNNGKGGGSKGTVTNSVYGNNKGKVKIHITVTGSVYGNKGTVTGSVYGNKGTVTGSVYGHGHNGAHGLLNAYGNVKDKPAGERIASLLKSKYGIDVTIEENADLAALISALEAADEKEAAAYVQGMADVLANPSDLESYKKLGAMNKKLGKKDIGAFVNGEELLFDVAPVVEAGHTLVPFRAIAEALNADVLWDAATQTVTVTRDGIEVKIVLGSNSATVNGSKVKIEYPGKMNNNRVMVPLRFLGEALKAEVKWEPESRCVIILDSAPAAPASTNE